MGDEEIRCDVSFAELQASENEGAVGRWRWAGRVFSPPAADGWVHHCTNQMLRRIVRDAGVVLLQLIPHLAAAPNLVGRECRHECTSPGLHHDLAFVEGTARGVGKAAVAAVVVSWRRSAVAGCGEYQLGNVVMAGRANRRGNERDAL